ncbi:transporter substrate-binding domain-containing protein [Umboniibacter marinipuniceus]|uniref:Sensory/regulatory protein RpfC n=1 Tax=Umboniibacter marinipuniceus TaxID=569599 RepID=A0A3M0A4U2_9GAMM|nr:transporter substrate-binding domain-containing protein [Umboniibacter marinipuniceus]RMA79404.1 signal transduction histidine kinase [Umboniibacter marinipuniceus]
MTSCRRYIIALLLSISSLLAYNSATAQPDVPEYRVAAPVYYPPYLDLRDSENPRGVVVDLWQEWAQRQGVALNFVAMEVDAGTRAVAFGDVDIYLSVLGEYLPSAVLKKAKPYYGISVGLYHAVGINPEAKDIRLVTTPMLQYSPEFTRFANRVDNQLSLVGSDQEAMQALLSGEADVAMVGSTIFAENFLAAQQGHGLVSDHNLRAYSLLYPVVRSNRTDLRLLIDRGFDVMPRERLAEIEVAQIDSAAARYFQAVNSGIRLSEREVSFVESSGPIRVVFPEDPYAPFYFDNRDQLSGIDLDLLRLLSERTGLSFDIQRVESWDDGLASLEQKEADLLTSVVRTDARSEYLSFTDSYYTTNDVIVTRRDVNVRDLGDLRYKLVALQRGWRVSDEVQRAVPQARILFTNNVQDALSLVANGTAFAFVGNSLNASYEIDRGNHSNLKVATPIDLGEPPVHLAVRNDRPELVSILNKGLASVTEEELTTARNRWFRVQYDYGLDRVRFYRYLGVAGLVIAGFFIGIFLWNQRLRHEVKARQRAENELIAAREVAESAADAKSSFLATMSHEIRTPLNGVLGMLEVLAQSRLDEVQQDQLRTVRSSGESLLEIINDVLDFSKIDAGKLIIERIPVDVVALISHAHQALGPVASKRGLQFNLVFKDRPTTGFMLDQTRVRQVIMNLLGNALKFTERGKVDIVFSMENHAECWLKVQVIDTGIGIDSAQLETIFAPFQQAESSTSRRFGGTGLGLSICKRLVDLMAGELSLRPNSPQGTVATFRFPAEPCALPAIASIPLVESVRPLASAKILLVEDHPTNQKVTLAQLSRIGLVADLANNGVEALAAMSQQQYDLILSDCHMPEMDGYELVRRIRANEEAEGASGLPVIATTANALDGEREHCLEVGFSGYLPKPFSLRMLRDELAKYLSEPESEVELQPASSKSSIEPLPKPKSPPVAEGEGLSSGLMIKVDQHTERKGREPLAHGDADATTEPALPTRGDAEYDAAVGSAAANPKEKIAADADFAELKALVDDNAMLDTLLMEFLRSTHADLVVMKHAELMGDAKQLQSSAHRIKGTAPMVGAKRMAQLVTAVDRDAKAGQTSQWTQTKESIVLSWLAYLDAVAVEFSVDPAEIERFREI